MVSHIDRKNRFPMHIYNQIRFGLVDYSLLALIEHHGVDTGSGHYTCFVKYDTDWFNCNDCNIKKMGLPDSSEDTYLLFFKRL